MSCYVPEEVRCRFCIHSFCCKDCREMHEEKKHHNELEHWKKEEYMQSICHMCHGLPLPYKTGEKIADDLGQHIVEFHMPLKCNKCETIFETLADVEQIGKCCIAEDHGKEVPEIKEPETPVVEADNDQMKTDFNCNENDVLSPLTKINLHWRRKSKEFSIKIEEGVKSTICKRTTSTPVLIQSATIDSITSIHLSSIKYISSASDSDFSPPLTQKPASSFQAPQPPPPPAPTPMQTAKRNSTNAPQSKKKFQNTPLRQVMTKSIQKAIATHGHYKNFNLQQRKMTFDSSSSSNERTVSRLMINESNAPLDLRTSPAIRRGSDELGGQEILAKKVDRDSFETDFQEIAAENVQRNSFDAEFQEIKIEEIQVIYRTNETHDNGESSSSVLTNYKSCYSDTATPKVPCGNMLKKTISFETPPTIEKTPSYLLPRRTNKRLHPDSHDPNKINNNNNDYDENEDDDVFYTPKSTPVPSKTMNMRCISSPDSSREDLFERAKAMPSTKIWNYMASVVGSFVGGGKRGNNEERHIEKKWTNAIPNPIKAAVEYFGKHHEKVQDIRSQKRRHSSSENAAHGGIPVANTISSPPIFKRRRIQGRKPIKRLQNEP